ncbi:MAG: AAA family ATPase, partial [Chthoniobacterales bacterium]
MSEELKFSALDRQFGDFLRRLAGSAAAEVGLVAKCTSRARAQGHVCITLGEIATATEARSAASLRKRLRTSGVVGEPGDFTPLILDQADRLYLRRYWEYEQQLAAAIRDRTTNGKVDSLGKKITDLQELAAARAVRNNFTVITGGPGTGKTQTVKKILARLFEEPGGDQLR